MYWRYPNYLWAEGVPVLLLLCWGLAERVRRRHLKEFGDPQILGISTSWVPRIAVFFLLVLGLASAAAVIPLPTWHTEEAATTVREILILLDAQSFESAEDQLWESLDDAVQAILEELAALASVCSRQGGRRRPWFTRLWIRKGFRSWFPGCVSTGRGRPDSTCTGH